MARKFKVQIVARIAHPIMVWAEDEEEAEAKAHELFNAREHRPCEEYEDWTGCIYEIEREDNDDE